jgi:hypothetical protein
MRGTCSTLLSTDFGSCCLGIADCMQGVLCIIFRPVLNILSSVEFHILHRVAGCGSSTRGVWGHVDRKSVAIDKWLVLPGCSVGAVQPTGIPGWCVLVPRLCSGCLATFAGRMTQAAGRVLPFPCLCVCVRVSRCRSLLFTGTPCCRVQAKPLCMDGSFITPVCDALNGR